METSNIPGGTLRITLANASQYIIAALFYVIVTKTNALTQTDIGTLSILTFLASAFSLLTMIALPTALTKFTSEKLGKNQKEDAAATQKKISKTIIMLSITGLAVAILSSQLLSQFFLNNVEYTIILVLNFTYAFLSNLIALYRSTLQALYLFGKMATITITYIVISRAIAITLALFNLGIAGVIIGYIIGVIIALMVAINFLRGKLPKTTKNMPLKPLLSYSLPLFLTSITNLIMQWADIVIITSLTGDLSLTGVYSITVSSVGALTILYIPIMTTIFPALSVHHGLQKPESLTSILKTTSRYLIYILFPSCIGLAIIAPTALTFFYGPSYAAGAAPLAILSITTLIIALISLLTTTLTAIGKTGQILKINIIAATASILALIALVPLLQTTGAAIARLTTNAIAITLTIYILKKDIKIRLDKEALWKSAVSTAATAPFLLAIEFTLSTKLSTIPTIALEILTAAAIYALSLYSLKALKKQDFQLLKQAFPKPLTKYISFIERIFVR